jgi:hypothetical protein
MAQDLMKGHGKGKGNIVTPVGKSVGSGKKSSMSMPKRKMRGKR